jgi:hypothetical protein
VSAEWLLFHPSTVDRTNAIELWFCNHHMQWFKNSLARLLIHPPPPVHVHMGFVHGARAILSVISKCFRQ